MEKEAKNHKRKKNRSQPKPDGLKPKAIKWKKKPQQKKKKNPPQPKPDGLKPKAIKWKKKPQIKKPKKIHHSLNPTNLNQRQ